jgi:hypothetical protein
MDQAVNRQSLIEKARVHSRVSLYGTCVEKIGTGA